jgi:hypothetical protein
MLRRSDLRLGKGAALETVLIGLAALACPVGMGVMMWFMAKGMRKGSNAAAEPSIEELRAEHARLGEEIERLDGTRAGSELSGAGR